jgi:uncharacterized protein
MTSHLARIGPPSFLIVPGLNNSGPTHWQTLWLRLLRNTSRVELGDWHAPDRETWVARLDEAIRDASGPVILCAHSLGCHAVAWWAATRAKQDGWPVAGALLVAPPECEDSEQLSALPGFAPRPLVRLPFPSILAGSRNDHYATLAQSRRMAREWGSIFVDAGEVGHINAESGIGLWPDGLSKLGRLLALSGFGRRHRDTSTESVATIDRLAA